MWLAPPACGTTSLDLRFEGWLAACAEVGEMEPLFRAAGLLLPVAAVAGDDFGVFL